jgi:hypothetical protein
MPAVQVGTVRVRDFFREPYEKGVRRGNSSQGCKTVSSITVMPICARVWQVADRSLKAGRQWLTVSKNGPPATLLIIDPVQSITTTESTCSRQSLAWLQMLFTLQEPESPKFFSS